MGLNTVDFIELDHEEEKIIRKVSMNIVPRVGEHVTLECEEKQKAEGGLVTSRVLEVTFLVVEVNHMLVPDSRTKVYLEEMKLEEDYIDTEN